MFEWLTREGWIIFSWWLLVTLAGAAIFPLFARLLTGLPDRGYTLARAAGVIVVAFVYWILAVLGFLQNTTGGMALAWLIVLLVSLGVYLRRTDPRPSEENAFSWRDWWRENRVGIIAAELVFAVMFIAWATVRAYQNGILYTEKDMELAFISSVMRSESFPPNDPWMAGYAISYYYFGYVMAGMLSMLSGINSTTGFNMMISLIVALVSLTVYGVGYNLVRSRAFRHEIIYPAPNGSPSRIAAVGTGLVAALLVVLMGNWQVPLVEIPYQSGGNGAYLQWFDSNERQQEIGTPSQSIADWSRGGWWWFRASRVINDRQVINQEREEVIDEFPAFSYVLADVHPHVLSLPFLTLGIGLALNALFVKRLHIGHLVLYAICIGGLIFLNTWDVPLALGAVIAADGLRRMIRNGAPRLSLEDIFSLVVTAVILIALSVLFYLPFLISFRSQLGGILPNIQYPTVFHQFFAMFAPFLVILFFFLALEAWRGRDRMNWRVGILGGLTILGVLLLVMLLLVLLASFVPNLRGPVLDWAEANGGLGAVLGMVLSKRIAYSLTAAVLVVGLILVLGRLIPVTNKRKNEQEDDPRVFTFPPATGFALILIAAGLLLTLAPEFVYLRDNFGTRMNTVFKFYYQVWLVWGIASAYAIYTVLLTSDERKPSMLLRGVFTVLTVVMITGGLLFTVFAVYSRTIVEPGRSEANPGPVLTLDGGDSFVRAGLITADDYASLQCLSELVVGDDVIIAEAMGNSYGWGNGRYATITGLPMLYNWPGHQGQWRGNTLGEIAGSRQEDLEQLYANPTWSSARDIINRYGIDYIVFGSNERDMYGTAADVKFRDTLPIVCEVGDTRVYRVDPQSVALQ